MLTIKPNKSNFLYLTLTNNTNLPPPKWPKYRTMMGMEVLKLIREEGIKLMLYTNEIYASRIYNCCAQVKYYIDTLMLKGKLAKKHLLNMSVQ